MKRFAIALVGAIALLLGLAIPAFAQDDPPSSTPCVSSDPIVSFNTQVSGRPDSGHHGNWATDDFNRHTKVQCMADKSWLVTLTDSGKFKTTVGALSPMAGVAIASSVQGKFQGGTSFRVTTSSPGPTDPISGANGQYSSSEWINLVFPQSNSVLQYNFDWTYTRYCNQQVLERWVNSNLGETGDILGLPCVQENVPGQPCKSQGQPGIYQAVNHKVKCVVTPPTSTTTTTTLPSTTTTTAPEPTGVEGVAGNTATTTALPVTNSKDSDYDTVNSSGLAYTGSNGTWWYLAGGLVLLVIGAAGILISKRRKPLPTVQNAVDDEELRNSSDEPFDQDHK